MSNYYENHFVGLLMNHFFTFKFDSFVQSILKTLFLTGNIEQSIFSYIYL